MPKPKVNTRPNNKKKNRLARTDALPDFCVDQGPTDSMGISMRTMAYVQSLNLPMPTQISEGVCSKIAQSEFPDPFTTTAQVIGKCTYILVVVITRDAYNCSHISNAFLYKETEYPKCLTNYRKGKLSSEEERSWTACGCIAHFRHLAARRCGSS
jgi:hypothetical protein